MQINRKIFKPYDIRGLIDPDMTTAFAEGLGKAFATFIGRETKSDHPRIVVGYDMRPSSVPLEEALVAGLQATGAEVVRIGLVSTPAFYFGVSEQEGNGGIMVSASHNPAEYNGFKLVRSRSLAVSGDTGILTLADMMEADDFVVGQGSVRDVAGVPERHAAAEVAYADVASLPPLKIVADTANGMGAQYLDAAFALPPLKDAVTLTRLYWDFDGTFPNHEADPFKTKNTEAVCAKVKELGADIGIATDGDGDRIFFIDDKGEVIEPAIIRGLVARAVLAKHPGATICYDIRPGKITEDMITEAGGRPVVTKVGHALIKEMMIKEGAVFAGESSGHFYSQTPLGTFETPVTTMLIVLQELCRDSKKASEVIAPLKRYVHSGEINFHVEDKAGAIARIKQTFADGEILELDGLSVTYPTFWFNVRASNTESVLRLNLEAVDSATMEAKRDEIAKLISL